MPLPVFNWTREQEEFNNFLAGGDKVLHVSGANGAHFGHFAELIIRVCSQQDEPWVVTHVDLLNQAHSSPLGLVTHIIGSLGVAVSTPALVEDRKVSVASNIRSIFGDVHLEAINVQVASRSESELLLRATNDIAENVANGIDLTRHILLFQACHEIKMRRRKLLWASAWVPAIVPMLGCGLKSVFLYCDSDLEIADGALPAEPQKHIRLTEDRTHITSAEVSQFVASRGLMDAGEGSLGYARAILDISRSVRDVYARLALAELQGAKRNDR